MLQVEDAVNEGGCAPTCFPRDLDPRLLMMLVVMIPVVLMLLLSTVAEPDSADNAPG